MAYLHKQTPTILHRDMKSQNILLDATWRAKIADFGISRPYDDVGMTARVGTTRWTAPVKIFKEAQMLIFIGSA